MVQAIFLGAILLSPSSAPGSGRAFDHEMRRFSVTHGNGSVHERTEVRVFDARTKKSVWFRRFDGWTVVAWDDSHRSIAIAEPLSVTIWQSGQKVRQFKLPILAKTPGVGAYMNGVSWSPDSAHLLMRIPATMQDSERNLGRLVVMEARTGRSFIVADQVVTASWVSGTEISLRQVDETLPAQPSQFEPYLSEPRTWTTDQKQWFRAYK